MNRTFATEKQFLLADLRKMGKLVVETVENALRALQDLDVERARGIIEHDGVIDNYQLVIEESVGSLISKEKLTTRDGRLAIALIKVSGDLERVGDYSVNIAETVLGIKGAEHKIPPLVFQLSKISLEMLQVALDAFINENAELAEAVCQRDETADELFHEIHTRLTKSMNGSADFKEANQLFRHIALASWLERIADHAVNIGEDTVFVVTGKAVRY